MAKRTGKHTIVFDNPPCITGYGTAVGKKENEGPLSEWFDNTFEDSHMGEKTWEAAESDLLNTAVATAIKRSGININDINGIFSGDLLDQCVASTFGLKGYGAPHIGLFGACSTMALSTTLASIAVDSGAMQNAVAATCSHFCSAERQFRFPLEYGGKRTPTSQWTVTGSGALVLQNSECDANEKCVAKVKSVTIGRLVDYSIKDANNMGAAMAPVNVNSGLLFFKKNLQIGFSIYIH